MSANETGSAGKGVVRFGLFELDLDTGELRKKGARVPLQEQPFQVLAMLVDHPGELVRRDELRAKLWPEAVFVDFDHGLNKAIAKIRSALGDLAESPRFVETLERRGYRFIAAVERVHGGRQQPPPAAARVPLVRLEWGDRSIPLGAGSHLLGRDPGCAVCIASSFVSRRHARLVIDESGFTLHDLGSHNGTLVNGEPISAPRQLVPGDEIGIGPARLVLRLAAGDASTVTISR